jgi:hypothetical protein
MSDEIASDTGDELRLLLAIFPDLADIRCPPSLVLRAIGELYDSNKERLGDCPHAPSDLERGCTCQARWPFLPTQTERGERT